jgi:flagellar hook-basal body complex protein FliE
VNNPISRVDNQGLAPQVKKSEAGLGKSGESFDNILKKFVTDVNSLQIQADELQNKLATGEVTDIHDVMIAVEKANLSMELMLEIRNKIIEAYQEIMRMPV